MSSRGGEREVDEKGKSFRVVGGLFFFFVSFVGRRGRGSRKRMAYSDSSAQSCSAHISTRSQWSTACPRVLPIEFTPRRLQGQALRVQGTCAAPTSQSHSHMHWSGMRPSHQIFGQFSSLAVRRWGWLDQIVTGFFDASNGLPENPRERFHSSNHPNQGS